MRSVIQTAVRRTVTVCMVVVIVFAAGILGGAVHAGQPAARHRGICARRSGHISGRERGVGRGAGHASARRRAPIRRRRHAAANLFDGQRAALFFYFDYGVDLEEKSDEIRACIAKLELPAECAEPTLTTVDLNASAVATIAVWREDDDTEKLLADAQTLRGVLAGVEGVGDVVLTGGKMQITRNKFTAYLS